MWWVDALELGLYDPMDPPTNFWEIEGARTQYLAQFEEDDEEEEEELLKKDPTPTQQV